MKEKSFDSMNVVPFIDIMLVLLVIVLATATFINTGAIPIDLPQVETSSKAPENYIIVISAEGIIYYDSIAYDTTELEATVLSMIDKSSAITVRADKQTEIQAFATLMALLQQNGFEEINLQTEIMN